MEADLTASGESPWAHWTVKTQVKMVPYSEFIQSECDFDAGSKTRMLDRLEAKQLVRHVRFCDDCRVVNMGLTDAGRAVAGVGVPRHPGRRRSCSSVVADFGDEQFNQAVAQALQASLTVRQTPAITLLKT